MDLAQILAPGQCFADQRFATKAACLGDLARRAGAALGIAAPVIVEALQHREALGSTGLGNGIALPHARMAEIAAPFAILSRLREPLAFDAVDEKPVDIVCLVLLPADKAGEQLNVLAGLARKLRERPTLEAIRKSRDGKALHALLTAPV